MNKKEEIIRETSHDLARSRIEKTKLDAEKKAIEAEIERKRRLAEETELQRQMSLEVKEQIH